MGDHSKPRRFELGAALRWAKAHPKVITSSVVGAVGVITAFHPEFPAAAVVSAVHAILGV
ncbi:hypothetical protein ACH4M0_11270 [Streptomyces albidoflavus]